METFKVENPYWMVYFPTDACNYKCKHCYLENIPEKDEMSYEEVIKIFSSSASLKHTRIGISGGEPFLRKDIVKILVELLNLGYKLEITTNGAFPERIKEFLLKAEDPSRVDIAISIDGLKEVHDNIRGDGAFEKAIKSLKIVKECEVRLFQVNTVIQKTNFHQLEEIRAYFADLGVRYHFFIPLLSTSNKRVAYTDAEIEKALPYIHYKFDIKYLLTKGGFRIQDCHAGQTTCFMDPTGKVYSCMTGQRFFFPKKDYFMGDIRKWNYRFDDLWTSGEAERSRKDVKKCEGCYNACEVHREKSFYFLDDNIDWDEVRKIWGSL
ncbi:radical SAM protein [Candidatus Woesearchaeota archaeon]|nr:radical SAM protein [Candidatus Woesearchaeota archaeon]